ncbi:hypothetical protein BZA77DRAFT_289689 [Pyronema omphalodes]|nr:hypothetical protein BZA77DRAFT_289689 [Pyronema omphalodes]
MKFRNILGLSLALYPYLSIAGEVGQMRNWWAIDGPGFVNTVGKLDSLRCFDGSSTNNSTVACEEIVSNATSKGFNEQHGELALSQLSSIENFTTAYKDAIGDAYKEAAALIAGPEITRKWFSKLKEEAKKEFFKTVATSSLRSTILSAFPWYDWNSSDVPPEVRSAQKKAWSCINDAVSTFGSLVASDTTAIAHHKGVTVDNYFSSIVDGHQHGVEDFAERIMANENGITTSWMKYGNVLEAEGLENLKDELQSQLARFIFLKAVNQALKDNASYITCTVKSFKDPSTAPFGRLPAAETCKYDKSGPADLKSCIDGDVCYMYRWKSESNDVWRIFNPEHNGKPPVDEIRNPPFSVEPSAIIDSTVVGALQGAVDFRYREDGSPITTNGKTTVKDLGDARVPGLFNLPVCYSSYSWNTPLNPSRRAKGKHIFPCNKNDPYCFEKVPPCYCGPWGSQTREIWDQININELNGWDYCDVWIDEKITDVIENWIAKRRMQNFSFDVYDQVMNIINTRGYASSSEIEPDIKFAIICQLRTVGPFTNVVDQRKKACKMYKQLWEDLKADPTLKTKGSLPKDAAKDLADIEAEFKEAVESGTLAEATSNADSTSTEESSSDSPSATIDDTTSADSTGDSDDTPTAKVSTRADIQQNAGASLFPLSRPSQNE